MSQSFALSVSKLPTKKYVVSFTNKTTGRDNTIHFGAKGYTDYTQMSDAENKKAYRKRHAKDYIEDISKPGAWSWWLLWNKPTLSASIDDMQKHFKITIISSVP